MSEQSGLRLMAVDAEDLKVLSAACQDSVCKPADIVFEKAKRRLHIELNRYRWEASEGQGNMGQRVRSILSFEDVSSVKARALPRASEDLVLSLLSVEWTSSADEENPEGQLRLVFAGDGEMLIEADCLNALLLDTDKVWRTKNRPEHKDV